MKKGTPKKKHIRISKKGKQFFAGKRIPNQISNLNKSKNIKKIQNEINTLIFEPENDQFSPELLEIVIRKDKAHHFDFLKGYTSWGTQGRWEKLDESNVLIQVVYKDTKDERIGKKLIKLLKYYNKKVIKEDKLFAITTQLEDTSI